MSKDMHTTMKINENWLRNRRKMFWPKHQQWGGEELADKHAQDSTTGGATQRGKLPARRTNEGGPNQRHEAASDSGSKIEWNHFTEKALNVAVPSAAFPGSEQRRRAQLEDKGGEKECDSCDAWCQQRCPAYGGEREAGIGPDVIGRNRLEIRMMKGKRGLHMGDGSNRQMRMHD
ncbi:hypothetical protein R3P38DRAFT_2799967 [Favolaschia claudopus]|uniref:4Fe-4S ferredoxin-type domain-containing protein n=1 Tax=Favolaschia claudopus TaxID=2862362 RepID=A0AAV9ZZ70_9AGAR